MSLVRREVHEGVALVTLDDPGRRNALSLEMADELTELFSELEAAAEVGAVVVTGNPPAFSAGADLQDLERADADGLRRIYRGFLAVAGFPLPTIAAVNGAAVGAGLNMALACDVRLAGRSARFESRFVDLALHPGGGHTWMLRQLIGPQGAAAVVLCGEPLDGEAASRAGLAWRCVDDDALVDEALRLAGRAAATPRELMRRLKASLRGTAAVTDHAEAVERELEPQLWSKRQPEFAERIRAIRERIKERRS